MTLCPHLRMLSRSRMTQMFSSCKLSKQPTPGFRLTTETALAQPMNLITTVRTLVAFSFLVFWGLQKEKENPMLWEFLFSCSFSLFSCSFWKFQKEHQIWGKLKEKEKPAKLLLLVAQQRHRQRCMSAAVAADRCWDVERMHCSDYRLGAWKRHVANTQHN